MWGIGVGAGHVFAGVIVGVLISGCRANPVFAVDYDDDPETSAAASSSDGTTRPEQTGVASTDTSDSGPDSTTADASAASETSTGAPETSDGTTDAPDTDDSAATSDSDATTGEVEQEIYDLHERCDLVPDTVWLAEFAGVIADIPCHTTKEPPPPPPWAGYLFDFIFDDQIEPRVVHMMPQQKPGAQVTGEYNGLQLTDAVAPHLRAVFVCPGNPCSIIGSVRVEDLDNKPIVGQEEIPLGPGQMQVIDLDLGEFIDVLSEQPFRVVLAVTGQDGNGGDRGVWVRPRIVDVQ